MTRLGDAAFVAKAIGWGLRDASNMAPHKRAYWALRGYRCWAYEPVGPQDASGGDYIRVEVPPFRVKRGES